MDPGGHQRRYLRPSETAAALSRPVKRLTGSFSDKNKRRSDSTARLLRCKATRVPQAGTLRGPHRPEEGEPRAAPQAPARQAPAPQAGAHGAAGRAGSRAAPFAHRSCQRAAQSGLPAPERGLRRLLAAAARGTGRPAPAAGPAHAPGAGRAAVRSIDDSGCDRRRSLGSSPERSLPERIPLPAPSPRRCRRKEDGEGLPGRCGPGRTGPGQPRAPCPRCGAGGAGERPGRRERGCE